MKKPFALLGALASACGAQPASPTPSAPKPLLELQGVIDPANGRLSFDTATSVRGFGPLTVEQDGVAGAGSPGTVELVTSGVGWDCGGGGANSWGGAVSLNSFTARRCRTSSRGSAG